MEGSAAGCRVEVKGGLVDVIEMMRKEYTFYWVIGFYLFLCF